MEEMHHAAGAAEAITINRYAHLIGGCRMAADEQHGVVDANLRSFAIPNLFVVDGSVCPTQGSANPALTIMALAARAADYLAGSRLRRIDHDRTRVRCSPGAARLTWLEV